jgi:Fe2+ or Zn2+ uptake regulation protein
LIRLQAEVGVTVSSLRPSFPVDSLDAAFAVVRREGLRLSAARRIVLQALFAADGPITAERIASGLDGRLATLDLTSVYRNFVQLQIGKSKRETRNATLKAAGRSARRTSHREISPHGCTWAR